MGINLVELMFVHDDPLFFPAKGVLIVLNFCLEQNLECWHLKLQKGLASHNLCQKMCMSTDCLMYPQLIPCFYIGSFLFWGYSVLCACLGNSYSLESAFLSIVDQVHWIPLCPTSMFVFELLRENSTKISCQQAFSLLLIFMSRKLTSSLCEDCCLGKV